MLLINCPFCGARNESEFAFGGTATAPRPADPHSLSDSEWVDWLTIPENPMGPVDERWWHARGCGLWLTITRDTVTHDIKDVRHGR